jgi:hypothetical protein
MIDFTDPESIRAWLKIDRHRHLRQLRALYRLALFAPFRDAMTEAAR